MFRQRDGCLKEESDDAFADKTNGPPLNDDDVHASPVLTRLAVEAFSFLVLKVKAGANEARTDQRRALSPYHNAPWADRYWREFVSSNRVEYHPYVIWRRRPFVGETINVDSFGLRRTKNTQCSDRSFTIWMFGGSTLWGSGSPDEVTIPSLLAAEYARDGHPVCVRNYGEMAWVSTQEVIKLLLELKHAARKPDLVVFYDGANDGLLPYQSDWLDGHQNLDRIRMVFEQQLEGRDGSFAWLSRSNTVQLLQRTAQWIGLANREAALATRYRARRNGCMGETPQLWPSRRLTKFGVGRAILVGYARLAS